MAGSIFSALAQSLVGTAVFLVLSFTIGRRLVFPVIRWANDRFISEVNRTSKPAPPRDFLGKTTPKIPDRKRNRAGE